MVSGRLLLVVLLIGAISEAHGAGDVSVQFVDVAAAVGIDFVHTNGMSSEKRLPETTGSGCAFFDYDGDDDLDLYLVNSGDLSVGRVDAWNHLYRNEGGSFVNVTEEAAAIGAGYGMGVVAGDYDSDGDSDLYLTNWDADILYRNDGGRFARAEQGAGLRNPAWGTSASFLDYDRDGDLDLYVANYVHFTLDSQLWCGRRDLELRFTCDPRGFEPVLDRLFRNEGDGTFTDAGREAGIIHAGNGLGVVSADFDGDGDTDIYVANDLTPNLLYDNQGDGSFVESGLHKGVAMSADGRSQAGMGVDAGDYDNDGDLDLFVSNYQLDNNDVYRNDGDFFQELSARVGIGQISLNYLGFGAGFFDYDNDGWLDLFIANGHVHDNIALYDELVTYEQRAQVFQGDGRGRFVERTQELGSGLAASYVGRGSAFGDYDRDGDLDVALMSSGRRSALLRNDGGNAGNWLQVQLEGVRSNRDGLGARVTVEAAGLNLIREVKSGSSFLSSSQTAVFFGLGWIDLVEDVEIRWPSGTVQVVQQIAVNQTIKIVEATDRDE